MQAASPLSKLKLPLLSPRLLWAVALETHAAVWGRLEKVREIRSTPWGQLSPASARPPVNQVLERPDVCGSVDVLPEEDHVDPGHFVALSLGCRPGFQVSLLRSLRSLNLAVAASGLRPEALFHTNAPTEQMK